MQVLVIAVLLKIIMRRRFSIIQVRNISFIAPCLAQQRGIMLLLTVNAMLVAYVELIHLSCYSGKLLLCCSLGLV